MTNDREHINQANLMVQEAMANIFNTMQPKLVAAIRQGATKLKDCAFNNNSMESITSCSRPILDYQQEIQTKITNCITLNGKIFESCAQNAINEKSKDSKLNLEDLLKTCNSTFSHATQAEINSLIHKLRTKLDKLK